MICRLCGNNLLKEIETVNGLCYFCKNCNLIFKDEKHIVSPEKEKARYEKHDNNHENEGYVNMLQNFIDNVIKPYKGEINSVLEFGCGPGPVLADLLEDMGFTVDKYDPYFYPDKDYLDKKYDLITSTEVFEHLENPYNIIDKLYNCLTKNGYLGIMTSFHPGCEELKDWWYIQDPTHITFYNLKTFEWIANEFNLKLIFTDQEQYCLFRK